MRGAVRYRANIFFTAAVTLPLLLFSPLQGDFRLVDFYLNLICKKSPRVAIVIVVSLRARPLLNRRRRSRKRRDGGRIISSHLRKLQKCRKWKLFMIHFALTGALIANDFRDGRKCGFKGPAIFPLSLVSAVDRESREQRTWNIFGDRERGKQNHKRRPLAMSRRRPSPPPQKHFGRRQR